MIQVEGLTKYYGNFTAIDRLSFHAEPGEIVGFLGRNGAGKTTTMRILSGYMPPNEGTAQIAGYDVFTESLQARQALGYLPETVPMYSEMTVWQYIDYLGSLRGMRNPEKDKRIEEVLERVDMIDREDSMISNLSKGMRQRVGLAQALVHSPSVLILDEPTIGLDPGQVRDFRDLIKEVAEDRTVMLSTHILSEVEKLCSRVIVIDKGRIVAEDSIDQLGNLYGGASRCFVRAAGIDDETLSQELSQLAEVAQAYPLAAGVEVVGTGSIEDIRPIVASAVVSKGWPLVELRATDSSIEDIFLQLTQEEYEDSAVDEYDEDFDE